MSWDDFGDTSDTANPNYNPWGEGTSYNPYQWDNANPITGSGLNDPYAGWTTPTAGGDPSWWNNVVNGLSGISPQLWGALAGGIAGGTGLIGGLASGGQGPTVTNNGTTNQTGFNNQTGTTNVAGTSSQIGTTNQTGTQNQTGYANTNQQPTLLPAANDAIARLTSLFNSQMPGAMSAYNTGLQGIQSLLATGGGNLPAAPNTTPAGYNAPDPWSYDPALMKTIKRSFDAAIGDIGANAINDARARGFAGGADLLGNAASPYMGQALARMPSDMAARYLDAKLGGYSAQQNAQIGGMNAQTNALFPGVQAYAAQANAQNQNLAAQASLLNALMSPMTSMMNANLGLLNALPHGQTGSTLTGGTNTNTLSGITTQDGATTQTGTQTNQSNSGQTGNTSQSGVSTTPMGTVVGNGLGNIASGAAQGYAAMQPNVGMSLLQYLMGGRRA